MTGIDFRSLRRTSSVFRLTHNNVPMVLFLTRKLSFCRWFVAYSLHLQTPIKKHCITNPTLPRPTFLSSNQCPDLVCFSFSCFSVLFNSPSTPSRPFSPMHTLMLAASSLCHALHLRLASSTLWVLVLSCCFWLVKPRHMLFRLLDVLGATVLPF